MYTFIVNPNAKTSLGYQVWSSLEAILKEKNVNYQVFFTKYQKHATRLAQKLTQESGAKTLIVLGGDGTVSYTHLDVYKRQTQAPSRFPIRF